MLILVCSQTTVNKNAIEPPYLFALTRHTAIQHEIMAVFVTLTLSFNNLFQYADDLIYFQIYKSCERFFVYLEIRKLQKVL